MLELISSPEQQYIDPLNIWYIAHHANSKILIIYDLRRAFIYIWGFGHFTTPFENKIEHTYFLYGFLRLILFANEKSEKAGEERG